LQNFDRIKEEKIMENQMEATSLRLLILSEFSKVWEKNPDPQSYVIIQDVWGPICESEEVKNHITSELATAVFNSLNEEGLLESISTLNPQGDMVLLARITPKGLEYLNKQTEIKNARSKISILFLSADPTDASRLRLGEELREIQEKLQIAKLREKFSLDQRMSVRPADISQAMLDLKPKIVHFSGHGTSTGKLCFENEIGEIHPIEPEALAALFKQFADQVSCVLLNACYSEAQAKTISAHIDYVIGMNQEIGDKAAISFSVGFYQALGAGETIEKAFELGVVQVGLQDISEHLVPVLIKKKQV
jgi:DNA-binding PadR family transcriptional regulator